MSFCDHVCEIHVGKSRFANSKTGTIKLGKEDLIDLIDNINFTSVVPNHCWYANERYECGLSLSCVFSGAKALDLCNGGMIWSCCVPRDRLQSQVRIMAMVTRVI